MSDLISRSDAIEAVGDWMQKEYGYLDLNRAERLIDALSALPSAELPADAEFADMPDIPRYYYEKVVGNMAHEINMLKEQLESAEAEWIPCSERLPSEDGCYLVSTTGTNNDIIDIAYYTEEIWHKASRIKAWMPLPKPYKEDSEE